MLINTDWVIGAIKAYQSAWREVEKELHQKNVARYNSMSRFNKWLVTEPTLQDDKPYQSLLKLARNNKTGFIYLTGEQFNDLAQLGRPIKLTEVACCGSIDCGR